MITQKPVSDIYSGFVNNDQIWKQPIVLQLVNELTNHDTFI